jgi:hypothetical protein
MMDVAAIQPTPPLDQPGTGPVERIGDRRQQRRRGREDRPAPPADDALPEPDDAPGEVGPTGPAGGRLDVRV